ncbi:NAD(P)H dehydrogenase [Nostoc sp. 3335mG]|nr:NAD(P)H dehydrogenase [Nostoc sp. 3335mG]
MRVHLVQCHPLSDSLNAHLAGRIAQVLIEAGHDVDRLDLYAHGFSPALTSEERRTHYATPATPPDIVPLQERLGAAECLVLVFPTWWFSLPAMLKGWIDRVWAPGFAFAHGTPIRPLLTGLKSVIVVTTLGSPWWIDLLVMREPVRRVLKTGVIGACAPQAQFSMLSLHEAENVDGKRLARFEGKLLRALSRLG